jgi:hypothetical protein
VHVTASPGGAIGGRPAGRASAVAAALLDSFAVSNRLSSEMISTHTLTHSSQMNTVGPAISFRTSSLYLLQNEQRRSASEGGCPEETDLR